MRPVSLYVGLSVARSGLIDRSNQGDSCNLRRADSPPSALGVSDRLSPSVREHASCGISSLLLAAPALVGFILGFVVAVQADKDLERMMVGRLDPRGKAETWKALRRARRAMAFSVVGPLASPIFWCGFLALLRSALW
jgi:hypothetical protein